MMRKIIILFVFLLLPLWAIAYVVAGSSEAELDPEFKTVLQENLKINNLSKKAILSVEQLDLSNYHLTSVAGIEQFSNLKQLDLSHNLLTDGSFLDELPHLEEVDVSHNQLHDVTFKSDHIIKLNVRGNLINSVHFVESLPNLTDLNVRDNEIKDISPITNNKLLTYLNIRGNQVKSLDPLASLHSLTDLNIRDNKIKSIAPIIDLPLEKRLSLAGNAINDLHLLDDKRNLIDDIDFEMTLPKPILSKDSGFYNDSFTLEIEAEEGLEVYYTLDGSTPNSQAIKYNGPVEISKELMLHGTIISNYKTSPERDATSFKAEDVKRAVTIKAVTAFKPSNLDSRTYSEPITATYILDEHLANSPLPIVSLTVDPFHLFDHHYGIYVPGIWYESDSLWSGNYAQRGREFEREATFELFDETKQLDIHHNVGIRINGRASRRFPQKSLRIYARDDYGQSAFYTNIFKSLDDNKFNLLLLRNSGQDYSSTFIRDGLMHELVKNLDVDVQAYQPAIVLINGEYWGIQNIRERLNEDYIVNKYHIDEDDLILMKVFAERDGINFEVKSGKENAKLSYFELLDYAEKNSLSEEAHFNYIEKRMDIDNYLHYVAYQVYYANTDSFSNNMRVWRKNNDIIENAPKGHDGRWRWMFFDLDWGMGLRLHGSLNATGNIVDYNMIQHVLKDERRMSLFRNLMENEQAKEKFVYIMTSLLDNHFSTSNVQAKIDELAGNIENEIPHMINRWNNIESVDKWKDNIQMLHDFAAKRPQIVKQHLREEFNLTEEDIQEIEKKMSKNY